MLSGKIAVYTATSPYIFLFILMPRGLFLEGAFDGIYYLFTPDLNKLWEGKIWVEAGV